MSIIVVRSSDDEIKGYWNSCLHRGVPLRKCSGNAGRALQCPFHGFTWSLEGESVMIPHPEQFPDIDQENFRLPQVQVAQWMDFVFINPDLDAEPFDDFIGPLVDSEMVWPYKFEVAIHVSKIFNGNWKSLQESFMEGYHILTTHPQTIIQAGGDHCGGIAKSGNACMAVLPIGLTNEYLKDTPDEQTIYAKLHEVWDDEEIPEELMIPDDATARSERIRIRREDLRQILGSKVDRISDTQLMDVHYWTVFPNFHPFGVFSNPLVYNFRPYKNDPDKSIMDVIRLRPIAEGAEPTPMTETIMLNEEEEYSSIKELGYFGAFIAQDSDNMNSILNGLRNSQTGIAHFAHEYEAKIRHFYSRYEQEMGLSAAEEVAELKKK